jgi:hypothetical protein
MAPNEIILDEMEKRGYGRISTLRAKARLCIASKKADGVWNWVTYGNDVIEWIEKKLENGPVHVATLLAQAEKEHMWHRETVKMAKEAIGTIRYTTADGKVYWVNLSEPEPTHSALINEAQEPGHDTHIESETDYIYERAAEEIAKGRNLEGAKVEIVADRNSPVFHDQTGRYVRVDFSEAPELTEIEPIPGVKIGVLQ